jgi:hypothetical protein
MMAITRWALAIVSALLFAGCASVPRGPSVMALPGSAKSTDEFRADEAACHQVAAADETATKQWRYDMTYLECMYTKANQIPVPSGASAPAQASPGSSPPAAAPASPATTTPPANDPAK